MTRIRIGDDPMVFSFHGLGTHYYGTGGGALARKAGEFDDGVYTCWLPTGHKVASIAWDDGLKLVTFTKDGAIAVTFRSKGLAAAWHPTGQLEFVVDGGRFQFHNADGTQTPNASDCPHPPARRALPTRASIVPAHHGVFGNQHSCRGRRLRHDQAIERIACPALCDRCIGNLGKRQLADPQANLRRQRVSNHPATDADALGLVQVLELQNDHRRNEQGLVVDQLAGPCTQQIVTTGIQPGDDVRVEVDQGFQASDQSR